MTVYACVGKVGMLHAEKFTEVCYVTVCTCALSGLHKIMVNIQHSYIVCQIMPTRSIAAAK